MHRTFVRSVLLAAATILIVVIAPAVALGISQSLTPEWTSSSMARWPMDNTQWWRYSYVPSQQTWIAWGKSPTPDFDLAVPGVDANEGPLVGFMYSAGASASIDATAPGSHYLTSYAAAGTHMSKTLDIPGTSLTATPVVDGSWTQNTPIEGVWWFNYRFFTTSIGDTGFGTDWSNTVNSPFGIDVTPPRRIDNLKASPTADSATATSTIPTSRVHLSWSREEYDTMSGVAFYQVLLDGAPAIPNAVENPTQGRVYQPTYDTSCGVTIEDLPPGGHTLGVCAVDRAGNEGPVQTVTVFSDPDVPTISITSPSANVIGVAPTIKVNAQDAGGVKKVDYQLDGYALGTATSSPFSLTADLSGFVNGVHTLTATVTDMYGRTATTSKTVTLDKTPLVLSSLKTGGSGRKPSASIYVNRAATVKIYIPRFKATKTVTTSKAGRVSFSYTYPKGKKYPSVTSFRDSFTITASDSLGNVTSVKGRWTVRISKVVKIGSNKVRIYYY